MKTPRNGTTRRTVLRTIGAGVVATSAVAGGASAQESETGTSSGSTHEVKMVSSSDGEYYFDPIGLHVQPGDTIRWTVESGSHNVVAYDDRIPEGADTFETEIISEGSHEMSFDVEGTYDYYCAPHQTLGMVGRFVVGEAGGPAEGSTPADGDVPESSAIVEQGSIAYDEFTGGSATSTPAPTETGTAAPTDTEPAEDEATEASGPGFTAVGALSALGAGALLRAYRNRDQ